jgi:chromosome segregation protein
VCACSFTDYTESKERFDFLQGQVDDLNGSEATLQEAIDELEQTIRERLKTTFAIVDREFGRYFESFFNGGKAHLSLTQPDDFANTGTISSPSRPASVSTPSPCSRAASAR